MKDNEILAHIHTTKKLTILYFMHDACIPCKHFKPIVEKVVSELSDYVEMIVVDSTVSSLAMQYRVRSVPTTIYIKDGDVVEVFNSTMTEQKVRTIVNSHIG
jgi:thioredoxin-like negative regulator of GroEL